MLAYNQRKQSTVECSGKGLIAKGSQDRERRKEKDRFAKKGSISKSRKNVKCFKCHEKKRMKQTIQNERRERRRKRRRMTQTQQM